ncbi:hypothetical protein NMY22_g19950 [Coprinellus aureogranulatus]|nr:hypothetical protein NMY22_g19950 [Coprinellus aureogranulatus]
MRYPLSTLLSIPRRLASLSSRYAFYLLVRVYSPSWPYLLHLLPVHSIRIGFRRSSLRCSLGLFCARCASDPFVSFHPLPIILILPLSPFLPLHFTSTPLNIQLEKKTPCGYGQPPYYDDDAHAPKPVGTGTVNPTPPSGHPTSNVRDSMTVGNDNPVPTHVTGGSTRAAEKAPEVTTTGQEEGYLPEEYVGARKGTEVAGGAGGEGELARDVD